MKLHSALPAYLSISFAALLLTVAPLNAELPESSQQLLTKLKQYESDETAKLDALLQQKRDAVIKILEEQSIDETRKGNLDGALAIKNQIAAMRGTSVEPVAKAGVPMTPPVGWKVPDDAVRLRGDYYKIYPIEGTMTWDQARAQCQQLGGELGWIDREDDAKFLIGLMQPLIDVKGHSPIWMGGVKDPQGEWQWLNGKEVSGDFWANKSDSVSADNEDVMIRWVGSFLISKKENRRVTGYLCRWKR